MNRPKTNINWIWWGLGTFFFAVIIFRIGAASAVSNLEGSGKKVGIVKINGPILTSDAVVSQLEKLKNRKDISAIVMRIDSHLEVSLHLLKKFMKKSNLSEV